MNRAHSYLAASTSKNIYTVTSPVSAIPILPSDESGSIRLGLLTQLPQGAEIEVGGPGFNKQTMRVRCGNALYFVFLDQFTLTDVATA